MNTPQVTLLVFVIIETLSILELYFLQDKPMFNGAGIFSGWEKSKGVKDAMFKMQKIIVADLQKVYDG